MSATAHADPEAFAAEIAPLGDLAPIELQVFGTALWPGQGIEGWVVHDDGRPVAAMLSTAGLWRVVAAPGSAQAVAEPMAARLPIGRPFRLSGEPELVAAVAGRWSERGGSGYRPVDSMRTYLAGDVAHPEVPGRAIPTPAEEFDHLFEWASQMTVELGEGHDRNRFQAAVARRHGLRQFWWWQLAEGPVAQLFRSRPAFGIVRIGGVYTPPAWRSNGYAAALTAAVTDRLHDEGHRVMLFTQSDNAGSNRIYRRIGYRSVGEVLVMELG